MRDTIVTAVADSRALLCPGWSGAQGLELPANCCLIEDTPHAAALGDKMRAEDGLASSTAIIGLPVNPHVDRSNQRD
jgi:hypothetical protein